jgi:hypothetical protein
MKKIKSTVEALHCFIKWRQTPIQGDIPSIILPRTFAGMGPGMVKQKPWDNARPKQCLSNSYLAPDNFNVVSGWMMSPTKLKMGASRSTGKAVYGWMLTAHFWNIDPITQAQHDGTPFVIPEGLTRKQMPYDDKDAFYILDSEVHHFMCDMNKCGFSLNIPNSLTLLDTGEVYKIKEDGVLGVVDFENGAMPSGWAPMLWDDIVLDETGKFKSNFTDAFEKLIEMKDSQ